ncbi:MAG: hypothetical protein K6G01_05200 [Eubacterium sp.]|nr:hypothetical protein [Eubacterium sp.]
MAVGKDTLKEYCHAIMETGVQVTLIGAVQPTVCTLGTAEELEQECKTNIDAMAKGGGFMLATGCECISPQAFDNAKRMYDIANEYGTYR